MTPLPIWFVASQLIGWTLVHFLWQGGVLGLVYALARPFLARGVVRYRFGMGVLLALALCPFVTLWRLLDAVPLMTAADHGFLLPPISSSRCWQVVRVAWRDSTRCCRGWCWRGRWAYCCIRCARGASGAR